MALIKPKAKTEKEQIRIAVNSEILAGIKSYCDYAGFKKIDEFFEEASNHILAKDKDYKEWKQKQSE